MYYVCPDRFTPGDLHRSRVEEPSRFEKMIDNWAFCKGENIEKPVGLVKWHSIQDSDLEVDPRESTWRKWEDENSMGNEVLAQTSQEGCGTGCNCGVILANIRPTKSGQCPNGHDWNSFE